MSDGKQAMAPEGTTATPPQAMPTAPGQAGVQTPSTAPGPDGAPAGNPELTVQDLGVLKTIIEVAQSRGAFKPNELEAIGKTYTKLETFLTSIQNQQVAAQGDAPVDPVPATSGE
jgi:hypothetical protein|tara:strand:+ start:7484 stop:7828 length:345 start_codon:yes stop_codon:yes gene_type:complete